MFWVGALKCLELGALGEEDVVVLAAEGPVEVDEVNGFVLDVLAEDGEVVAVIETVLLHCGGILARIWGEGNLLVWCGLCRLRGNAKSCLMRARRAIVQAGQAAYSKLHRSFVGSRSRCVRLRFLRMTRQRGARRVVASRSLRRKKLSRVWDGANEGKVVIALSK